MRVCSLLALTLLSSLDDGPCRPDEPDPVPVLVWVFLILLAAIAGYAVGRRTRRPR